MFTRITHEEWPKGAESSLQGYFDTSYAKLKAKFGEADEGDGHKVSTEWVFKLNGEPEVVTVYDYKDTELYGDGGPSVEKFRARKSFQWHIGARDKAMAETFMAWLSSELR